MKKGQKTEKITLNVSKREIFGKKLKALRRGGTLPANMYGEEMESTAVQLPLKEFTTAYKHAHETHIIYITLDGKEYPILIQHIQRHPVTDMLYHVDFRQVNLKKKIESQIPIVFTGESEAVHLGTGVQLTLIETILVEALPEDLPENIEIDVTSLKEINDEIKVSDIKNAGNYIIKDDPEKVIVRISEHKEEDTTPQIAAPDTVEITGEKKDEEAPEGEASADETPKEEAKKEKEDK